MALFGGGKKEEIPVKGLGTALNSCFDKKIAGFAGKAAKIAKEIENAKRDFSMACDKFDKLDIELNLEYGFWRNENFIKSQKSSYVQALKLVIAPQKPAGAQNERERYGMELESIQTVIGEVLKTNGKFKPVVMAYPNYLSGFQNSFSRMERLAGDLKAELERTDPELEEYNEVRSHIYEMEASSDLIGALTQEIDAMRGMPKKEEDQSVLKRLEDDREAKSKELRALKGRHESISSGLKELLLPLGKAAKSYDHSSLSKFKLTPVIENPIESLSKGEDAGEFMKRLDELKDGVEKGRISLKNKDDVLSQIARVEGYDVYGKISELKLMEKEEGALAGEIRAYENEMERIGNEKASARAAKESMEETAKKLESLKNSVIEERQNIEQLFLKYYNKQITVAVG